MTENRNIQGSVELLLATGAQRHLSMAPAAIAVGAIQLGGWHIRPVDASADAYPGQAAYLVRTSFDLEFAEGVPAPPWVDVGFALDDGAVIVDAVPHRSAHPQPSRCYRVDRHLCLAEVAAADTESFHLPETPSAVQQSGGAGFPHVRWRHVAPEAGTYTSWFVMLVPTERTTVGVTAFAQYHLPPKHCLGGEPVTRPLTFEVNLLPGRALPPAPTIAGASLGPDPEEQPRPRVFISYAHDDDSHTTAVREFATFLTKDVGLDVVLDEWNNEVAPDWYMWAVQNMTGADFVLVIASPLCRSVGEGDVDDDRNKGLQAEMAFIREELTARRSRSMDKYLAVVLPGGSLSELPEILQPHSRQHFVVTSYTHSGADSLIRALTCQPLHVRPPLAARLPLLPPLP